MNRRTEKHAALRGCPSPDGHGCPRGGEHDHCHDECRCHAGCGCADCGCGGEEGGWKPAVCRLAVSLALTAVARFVPMPFPASLALFKNVE